jgi:hypothetical protein
MFRILKFVAKVLAVPALIVAVLIYGGLSSKQAAVTATGNAADAVGFGSGVVVLTGVPRIASSFAEAGTYAENDANGKSTVGKEAQGKAAQSRAVEAEQEADRLRAKLRAERAKDQ